MGNIRSVVWASALVAALSGCSLVRSTNDFTFADAGSDAADASDASDAADTREDAPLDVGVCAVATDCPAPPRTVMDCVAGACERVGCEEGWGDCDGATANGCEADLSSSVDDCGACGAACSFPGAIPRCAAGECVLDACRGGFADCNSAPSDGCEANLATLSTCGSCLVTCAADELCDTSATPPACALDCAATICGESCVNPTNDPMNCGACATVCPLPADAGVADTTCAASVCGITCLPDRADCDTDPSTGCEINTSNDAVNCGACGVTCDATRGAVYCESATCMVSMCDAGYGDCNADGLDGCEADLGVSTTHCGACGNTCAAGTECIAGVCDPVVDASPGSQHTCVVRRSGQVACWGRNERGQSNPSAAPTPAEAPAIIRTGPLVTDPELAARFVAVGRDSTCVIAMDRTLQCWGVNNVGQLGDGTLVSRNTPGPVVSSDATFGARTFFDLDVGGYFACALDDLGDVWCWGRGGAGQTGTGSQTLEATRVLGISGPATAIAVGDNVSCALLVAGTVECWGGNGKGQLGRGPGGPATTPTPGPVLGISGVAALDVTFQTACAIDDTERLFCWGARGADAFPAPGDPSATPTAQLVATGVTDVWMNGQSVSWNDAGGATCAGRNLVGNLGDGTLTNRPFPGAAVPALDHLDTYFSGDATACALDGSSLLCWGINSTGQVQRDTLNHETPTALVDAAGAPSTGLRAAAISYRTACRIESDGTASCSGIGPRGDGTYSTGSRPVAVSNLTDIQDIDSGVGFSCAIEDLGGTDGTQAFCWGNNGGDMPMGRSGGVALVPEQVPLAGEETDLAAGYGHICAIQPPGQVYCWGRNDSGQLGRDTSGAPALPGPAVPGITDAVSIAAGRHHTCVVRATGAIACWGKNTGSQLGDGTVTNRTAPVEVLGISAAIAVEAGHGHTCAIVTGGEVLCWGYGSDGRLGDGLSSGSNSPVTAVSPGSPAVDIALGEGHTCAVYADGTAACWGAGGYYQTGFGSTAQVDVPTLVPGIGSAASVDAAFDPSFATVIRNTDGSATCFGYDVMGACGTGSEVYVLSPRIQELP